MIVLNESDDGYCISLEMEERSKRPLVNELLPDYPIRIRPIETPGIVHGGTTPQGIQ